MSDEATSEGEVSGEERQAPRFEALLDELEAVVDKLERGELPLDEALSEFERGSALVKRAGAVLDAAEARVTKLLEERDGALLEIPFERGGQ